MSDLSTVNVIGTDGGVPVYDPSARWCWWALSEVFTGAEGKGRYIPKVNDYVIDYDTYTVFIVTEINPVTMIPKFVEKRPSYAPWVIPEEDILFGVGPGTQADTYRVYYDTSVYPYVLAVDARLRVAGTSARYAKLFVGSDLSSEGKIISKMYDTSGTFLNDKIPLETVVSDSHEVYAIKVVSVCKTTENLKDGEVVTAIFYDDDGHVVSKRQLLIENTSFIRTVNENAKYITHISLESPFLSTTETNIINFPLNVPVNAMNLMGVVHYSDGSTIRLPVDGTKFKLYGLDSYISTIVGQKYELVLSYALSQGEYTYSTVTKDNNYITLPYTLVTTNPNNAYSVKLFGYPQWMGSGFGYKMRWYLYNLDRNISMDVTDNVMFDAIGGSYDPKAYGYTQRRTVSINLNKVSAAFKPYIHTQVVDIELIRPYVDRTTCWKVTNEIGSDKLAYGDGLYASRKNTSYINLSVGITNFNEWIERVYNRTYPLINKIYEINTISPTHFYLTFNGNSKRFEISDWNKDVDVGSVINPGDTVYIRFIKEGIPNDIELSVASMIVSA